MARPVPLPRRSGHALILGISIAAGASYLSVHQRLHADTNEQRPSDDDWAKRDPQGLPPPGELTKPALHETEDPGDTLRSRVVEIESHPDLGITYMEGFSLERQVGGSSTSRLTDSCANNYVATGLTRIRSRAR